LLSIASTSNYLYTLSLHDALPIYTDVHPYLSVSPDGSRVAYVAAAEGGRAIWVKRLDGAAAEQVAGTNGAEAPFWSPDGRAIGLDRKSTRLNSSHDQISYAVFCLK